MKTFHARFHVFSPFSAYFSPHYIVVEKGLLCGPGLTGGAGGRLGLELVQGGEGRSLQTGVGKGLEVGYEGPAHRLLLIVLKLSLHFHLHSPAHRTSRIPIKVHQSN